MKWGFFCKKVENGGYFVKKWKTGGIFGKSRKWGCFFVKSGPFSQRRVHYVQYQYFLFYILLIWGMRTHHNAPPRLQACSCQFRRDLWPSDCLWCAFVITAGMQTTPCFRRMKLSRRDGFTFDWTRDAMYETGYCSTHAALCCIVTQDPYVSDWFLGARYSRSAGARMLLSTDKRHRTLPAPACGISRRAIPTSRAASWEITEPNCSVPGDN